MRTYPSYAPGAGVRLGLRGAGELPPGALGELAAALRARGQSWPAIGARLGVPVYVARVWSAEHRGRTLARHLGRIGGRR